MPQHTFTLIVHGTFAQRDTWWRLGKDGDKTFADRLEAELSQRGLTGTVWAPALTKGLNYDCFSWSGDNSHRARVTGSRTLASNLNRLGSNVGATAEAPLLVNVVAHSHGGNVALGALRSLKPNIRIGGIVLLGTPFVTARPAFRVFRFAISTFLMMYFLLSLFMAVVTSIQALTDSAPPTRVVDSPREGWLTKVEPHPSGVPGLYVETVLPGRSLIVTVPTLIGSAWLFLSINAAVDFVWRLLGLMLRPVMWLRGRWPGRVYGPNRRTLTRLLSGNRILALMTQNDEADCLLQVVSSPARLYSEYVRASYHLPARLMEYIFVRPLVLGIVLKILEVFLECVALGFSWPKVLFIDYETRPGQEGAYYPRNLLKSEFIGPLPLIAPRQGTAKWAAALPAEGTVIRKGLYVTLTEVSDYLRAQIQLRHSAYYQNSRVIARVAGALVEGIGPG